METGKKNNTHLKLSASYMCHDNTSSLILTNMVNAISFNKRDSHHSSKYSLSYSSRQSYLLYREREGVGREGRRSTQESREEVGEETAPLPLIMQQQFGSGIACDEPRAAAL